MYCLSVIHSLNNRAAKPEGASEHSRFASFNLTRKAIILHSAVQRSTLYVAAADNPDYKPLAALLESARGSEKAASVVVEAYFHGDIEAARKALAKLRRPRKPRN